jgi:hypothetical protein
MRTRLCLTPAYAFGLVLAALPRVAAAPRAPGAGIVILPPRVTLVAPGPGGAVLNSQRLIVERQVAGVCSGDRTPSTVFRSTDASVARVTKDGLVQPVSPGTTTIVARLGGQTATATVQVRPAGRRSGAGAAPSFRNQVEPVLTRMSCNSGACHGAAAGKGGLKLTLRGYDPEADHAVLTRQVGGRRVALAEPERSLLLLKPTAAVPHGGGRRFPNGSPEYRTLYRWIAAGAPAPKPDDPRMERLEVFPSEATLARKASQQILVRAWFSDGHAEDVTRWVKFGASDSGVATVDDEGRAVVQGPGEAAITVWYLSQVAFARISSPFPGSGAQLVRRRVPAGYPREAGVWVDVQVLQTAGSSAGRHEPRTVPAQPDSFIDRLVAKKLRGLNIPASGPCTDAEFIRRAYLDAAGILPVAAEVSEFLADGRSAGVGANGGASATQERRARLIDALLERPEFVDHWAYKWSDLLLVSTRALPSPSVRAFYGWIRESVAQNKPWDRFAREIVTASGSTLENGATNYYALHRDPIDLTETTTQAFMGTSLTCARCHNHPMEKWTQNQYYAMANLFARVARKNGDGAEMVVFTADSGEVRHPRSGTALPPQPLDGSALALDAPGDRREHLAAWLTSPRNRYFARALVNRVWRQFMGRGLVEPEDDLRLTNPPSNEELLVALTDEFVRHGYDVKRLIRTVMNSEAYQRSSAPISDNQTDQKYYSHYIVRRLPAEVMLDALSQVTGVPTEFAGYPTGLRALQLPDSQVGSYFLTAFGRPERITTCSCERQQEPSVAQALHLANGDTLNQKLKGKEGVLGGWVDEKVNDGEVLRRLYLAALSRLPTPRERTAILPALAAAPPGKDDPARQARREVLEDLFWATLTGREFLFNH